MVLNGVLKNDVKEFLMETYGDHGDGNKQKFCQFSRIFHRTRWHLQCLAAVGRHVELRAAQIQWT